MVTEVATTVTKSAITNGTTKHKLNSKWVLWYLKGDRNRNWEDCLKKVAELDSVEDFWGLYSNIQPPSGLFFGSDYYLFRDKIRPMWEDSPNGGRWYLTIPRSQTNSMERLDHSWLELSMLVVGEQFGRFGQDICGLAVNIRQKGSKLAIWTRNADNAESVLTIGNAILEKLDLPPAEIISYEAHSDASNRRSSAVKPKYMLPDTKDKENGHAANGTTAKPRPTTPQQHSPTET